MPHKLFNIDKNITTPKSLLEDWENQSIQKYNQSHKWYTDILITYGKKVDTIVEYGTFQGLSLCAFLCSNPKNLIAVDIKHIIDKKFFYTISKNTNLKIINGNSLILTIPSDLVFLDTVHTYDHVSKELQIHKNTNKYIIIHDTNYPKNTKLKVRDAIILFCKNNNWNIIEDIKENTGIIVLERNELF